MATDRKTNRSETDVWIAAVSLIVIGLLLLIWPAISGSILCYLIGAALCGYGIFQLVSYFNRPVEEGILRRSFAKGLTTLIVGIVLFVRPELLVAVLPVIFGCILVAGGIYKLQVGLDLMRLGEERWYISAALAGVICILGILAILNPFGALYSLMRFIGIALLLEGLSDGLATWVLAKKQETTAPGPKDEQTLM